MMGLRATVSEHLYNHQMAHKTYLLWAPLFYLRTMVDVTKTLRLSHVEITVISRFQLVKSVHVVVELVRWELF